MPSPTPRDMLAHLPTGRILDVATGSGEFIRFLQQGLQGYTEIIGVDASERAAAAFEKAFEGQPKIRFRSMDANRLDFEPASFDLVCISNSLHHFDDSRAVLGQMMRVLRPGGGLIVSEMYCDGQTETQMTHVHLHHWCAAVDSANGGVHHDTFARNALVGLVSGLGLEQLAQYDLADLSDDPKEPQTQKDLTATVEQYLRRAREHADLCRQGEALLQRLRDVGFHSATTLVLTALKPPSSR